MDPHDMNEPPISAAVELSQKRREVRTALELAVVAMVPDELLQRLASAAGLLEAVSELPLDSPPLRALVPRLMDSARKALTDWNRWKERLPKAG